MTEQKRALPKGIIITPECRLSYPYLFTPKKNDQDKDRYSASLIFPKGTDDARSVRMLLNKAILDVLVEKFGSDGKGSYDKAKAGRVKFPIRDGKDYSEDPAKPRKEYEDCIFIGCSSPSKPGVILEDHTPGDANSVYAGCWVKAAIRAYWYEQKGNRGVTFSLEHIMKVRDDDSFGTKFRIEDVFGEAPAGAAFSGSGDEFMS